jgi:alpha galactosidase C-like protein
MTTSTLSLGQLGGPVAVLLLVALLLAPGRAGAAEEIRDEPVCWDLGGWQIEFYPIQQSLKCEHKASGAIVAGKLRFLVEGDAGNVGWIIVPPRDSVKNRLAILDNKDDVQGYLTFWGTGDTLRITPAHRAAQNYRGTLTWEPTARLGRDSFACRTRTRAGSQVVQMASGQADSTLNDSLFDVATDTALHMAGSNVGITFRTEEEGFQYFDVSLSAMPHASEGTAITLEIQPDYYRSRYVPYYKPINKERCPSPPTGWMSWNVYFDTAGEKENLDEARMAAKHLQPFGLEIWHIESWQDNSAELPVSKFHNLTLRPFAEQFPHGMKWLADEIRKLGFKPGIWTVPFGTGDDAYYAEHKEWFLHAPDGKPVRNWCGKYVVDPSQEAVRQHMEETHRIMSEDWGYEYFKIDGMSGRSHSYCAHLYEREDVQALFKEPCEDPFKLCVEALRRGMGPDRIWLACQGHYTGPEVGLADAGRLGADIVAHNRAPDWNNYSSQARTTLNQLFVNNIVWYGDPDTLLVGSANPLELVRLATSVVGLSGQMMFAGDKLAELSPERMRLLQQCLPVCDIRPLDLFPIFDMLPIWDLKVSRPYGQWDVVSLFNWGDKPTDMALRFEDLGLKADASYVVYDAWNQVCRGVHSGSFTMPVPARGNALLAVHPDTGHPQFLSTDRHITQGGTSLEDCEWDEKTNTLTGRIALVGGHPTTVTVYVPKDFAVASAAANGATMEANKKGEDGTFTITLRRETSGTAGWSLRFKSVASG